MNGETSQPPSKLYEEFFGSQDWARIMLKKVPETRVVDYMMLPASQLRILTPQQLALRASLPMKYGVDTGLNKRNHFLTTTGRHNDCLPKPFTWNIFAENRNNGQPLTGIQLEGTKCFGPKNSISAKGRKIDFCGKRKAFLERFCSECEIKFHVNIARRRRRSRQIQ